MWVFDLRTQRFLAVNEAATRAYGYTREEFLRLTIRDIRLPEDLPALEEELAHLQSDAVSIGIWRHRKKDGTIIDVEVLANEIDFNNHRARLVLAHDITGRLQIERLLRTGYAVTGVLESAESFHDAVPQILRAVCEEARWEYGELWRVDPESGSLRWDGAWRIPGLPSGDFERASGSLHVQKGVGIPGTTWGTGRPEWLTDLTVQTHFARAAAASRLGLRQGLSFPIKGHGSSVLGVMVFFSRSEGDPDDTFLELMSDLGDRIGVFLEREIADADRRQIQDRFMKAFYRNPLPAILSRMDGSQILEVNESFVRMFGYRRDELIGRAAEEVRILEHVDERADLLEPLRRGEGVHGIETTFRTKNGEIRTGLLSSERVEMGSQPTILSMIVDVTELRNAELRILESQRLASIGETAAFVAHQINTPLTNIALLSASLARQSSDAVVKEKLAKIDEQRRLASRIISEILNLTKPSDGVRETTELQSLVRMAADQAASYRGSDVALDLELGDVPVSVAADPLRLLQAFVNLFKNAYQATERGRVTVSLTPTESSVTVVIRDTGKGMPDEDRARLFQPFFSTKPRGEGTGLGLVFAKTVVLSHGGTIGVDSEPGKGSTFSVTLPR